MIKPNNFSSEYVRERDKVVAEHNAEVHLGKRPLCSCFRQGCDWATERAQQEIKYLTRKTKGLEKEQVLHIDILANNFQDQLDKANALIEVLAEGLDHEREWWLAIEKNINAHVAKTLAKYLEWKKR